MNPLSAEKTESRLKDTLISDPRIHNINSKKGRIAKRIFDIAVSSLALVAFPIILIPAAISIKLTSKGPVFYRQLRTGRNGRTFLCYKFRTMRNDANDLPVRRNDPRVTTVGRIMRKTSIDELPQIINVFLGQMSLVGPRPHMVTHTLFYQSIIRDYNRRLAVKPGITGLAQISGYRGATDRPSKMQRRIDADLAYIETWSPWLDIKIILRTVANIIHGEENAY
ncbi:MAG: sugar transferase [Paramuribaculum sp.]|nr:sugar transferase [Paramuribaculum sp.]